MVLIPVDKEPIFLEQKKKPNHGNNNNNNNEILSVLCFAK